MGCLCLNTTEPEVGEKLPAPKLVGKTANKLVQEVFELLKRNEHGDTECPHISVYGMAGVGKTAIMMNVYNQLLESQANPYEKLIWVSGPHDLLDEDEYIRKLQKIMASAINFHLPNKRDIRKRAKLLYKAFERFGNYLLFLDDIVVRLPSDVMGFNRVVTIGRSYFVIGSMECLRMLKVDLLPEKEACELFVNKIGIEVTPGMEDTAKEVVKECAGLPLTIVTIAEVLKDGDERTWRETLQKLRCGISGMMDTEGTLYKSLKYGCDVEGGKLWRDRFMFCVLYPKDWIILIRELIDYWSVDGLLQEHRMFSGFKEPFLLKTFVVNFGDYGEWGTGIKMHPLFREFALLTVSPYIMSKCGLELKELPDLSAWEEDLERASFMCNNITSISISPICPKLSTLFLNRNPELCSIADAFFVHMQNLEILDLRDNGCLESLPDSVSDLVNLRALRLSRCVRLKYIPSLAKLLQLKILEFDETTIRELPQGIDSLPKLRVLHFRSLKLKDPLPSKLLALLHSKPQLDLQI